VKSILLIVVAALLSTVGCATGGRGQAFSTISGTIAFEIYASTAEATGAARLVVERRGLSVLLEDSEPGLIEVGSADGTATFRVLVEPKDRQVRVVTSYHREAPGRGVDLRDDAESLSQQMREINDEIRAVLQNLPPRVPSEPGIQVPPTA
jgi:hypothetical protein